LEFGWEGDGHVGRKDVIGDYILAGSRSSAVFGRSQGARQSYLQWQEANVGPQVVFEILPASDNRSRQVDQERSRAEQAELMIQAAVPRLLGLGLSVAQVAGALGLSVKRVQAMADDQSETIRNS
jgi:hypothetical protein